ncbi:hypothetical protein FXF53_15390 [Micromonospora sp. WP24]|uniref:hypothetical protein n=1 Tax=Micromonospora sp. WP24 TaxID=2604469 RepID=UPI0011D851ED|nr:hypothetical protein [Micromonospora sp. WP24]TYB99567.1 hypothetical protein FXF53_15390 [Micromonospora sp. WP24]
MYSWIWRKLPFGLVGKLTGSVLLTAATVALLWYVVFPWAEPLLPFDDVQVTQDSEVPGAPPGEAIPGDDDAPPSDGHDLPYDTERNNTPPASPNR